MWKQQFEAAFNLTMQSSEMHEIKLNPPLLSLATHNEIKVQGGKWSVFMQLHKPKEHNTSAETKSLWKTSRTNSREELF